MFLEISQNSQENTWPRVSFLIKLQARPPTIKKETLTQVFSCEFCEISKNAFSYKTPPVAASAYSLAGINKIVSFIDLHHSSSPNFNIQNIIMMNFSRCPMESFYSLYSCHSIIRIQNMYLWLCITFRAFRKCL